MELIDRYLHAVKFWLPKGQADDIVAELAEDIQTEVDDQEQSLGRKLTPDEAAALLRRRGRPVLVANRYLPQEYLIGPVLFPVYKFVLKIVALCCLAPWVVGCVAQIMTGPRDLHGWVARFGSMWSSLWLNAFVSAGIVTIVFAVLERAEANSHFLENWDPRKLPPVRNPRKIARTSAAFELAVNLVVAVWWATNLSSRVILDRPFARIELSSLWTYFFWGFLAVTIANIALAAAGVIEPYRMVRRAAARLLVDCASTALCCWLLCANIVSSIAAPDLSPDKAVQWANAVNLWAARMLPAGLIVGAIIISIDAFRIWRLRTGGMGAGGRRNGPATGPSACASPLR